MVSGQYAGIVAMEQKTKRSFMAEVQERHKLRGPINKRREEERRAWKRDLSGRVNGTIDPWYGCDLFTAAIQYAINFTYPWNAGGLMDVSSSNDSCLFLP
jgi:carboxypeptidase D